MTEPASSKDRRAVLRYKTSRRGEITDRDHNTRDSLPPPGTRLLHYEDRPNSLRRKEGVTNRVPSTLQPHRLQEERSLQQQGPTNHRIVTQDSSATEESYRDATELYKSLPDFRKEENPAILRTKNDDVETAITQQSRDQHSFSKNKDEGTGTATTKAQIAVLEQDEEDFTIRKNDDTAHDITLSSTTPGQSSSAGANQKQAFFGKHVNRCGLRVAVVLLVVLVAIALGLGLGLSTKSSGQEEKAADTSNNDKAPVLIKWVLLDTSVSSDEDSTVGGAQGDQLGYTVAISGDGTTMAAGAPYGRYIRTFSLTAENTIQSLVQQPLVEASDVWFDFGTCLSHNASVLAVGSHDNATVYRFDDNTWHQHGPGLGVGRKISMSADGSMVAVGPTVAQDRAAVQVLRYNVVTNSWAEVGPPVLGAYVQEPEIGSLFGRDLQVDGFGEAISLSGDGHRLAVGIPGSDGGGVAFATGSIRIYDFNGTEWIPTANDIVGLQRNSFFGHSVALSADGNCVAGGAIQENPGNGDTPPPQEYVQVYCLQNGNWTRRGQTLLATQIGDNFGKSVALSVDGRTLMVGAPLANSEAGQVTMFHFDDDSEQWIQVGRFDGRGQASIARCGFSVSLSFSGDAAVVGCPFMDSEGASEAGAVRVYRKVVV